jgi:hypothetical protein
MTRRFRCAIKAGRIDKVFWEDPSHWTFGLDRAVKIGKDKSSGTRRFGMGKPRENGIRTRQVKSQPRYMDWDGRRGDIWGSERIG